MTSWADITVDELRDELDAYMGDEGMGVADGWYTVDELAALYGVDVHTVRNWIRQLAAQGRVEHGRRPARGLDGRRIRRKVYRLVEQEQEQEE